MDSSMIIRQAGAVALIALVAGCASMNRQEKATTTGAATGGVVGAVVGGPVGAAVGAGVGGYVGHESTPPTRSAAAPRAGSTTAMNDMHDAATVRSVQQSLKDKGFYNGAIDGIWGPNTEEAMRQFQQAQGLPQTGDMDSRSLAALGVPRDMNAPANTAPARTSGTGTRY